MHNQCVAELDCCSGAAATAPGASGSATILADMSMHVSCCLVLPGQI